MLSLTRFHEAGTSPNIAELGASFSALIPLMPNVSFTSCVYLLRGRAFSILLGLDQ